jgi:periplasmic protein TonB
MFERPQDNHGKLWQVVWSAAAHAVLLVALFRSAHNVKVRTFLAGAPQNARIELTYLPGGASPSAPQPMHKQAPPVPREARLPLPSPLPPSQAPVAEISSSSPGATGAPSNDAKGTDDIRIALTTYSPSPKPDLSQLPRGAQGDVVLDITIDPTGQVAELEVLQTIGYGVDGVVADTVRTWRFSPATRNGVPVASEQEVHFHYGPV